MPKVELNLEDDELKELLLGDRDKAMQSIMAKILDEILKSEATEQIKAKAYERSDERTNSRNGYRVRQLTTRVGSLELHVPKLRHGNFSTQLFKRYQRSEQAFDLALMEMVIQGVSTRKVAEITKKLCGTTFPKVRSRLYAIIWTTKCWILTDVPLRKSMLLCMPMQFYLRYTVVTL